MFQVGDEVEIVYGASNGSKNFYGRRGKITSLHGSHRSAYVQIEYAPGNPYTIEVWIEEIKLINKKTNIIMDLKEKFLLALTTEPKKSFRKTGITNGDDMLTGEGQNIFLTWLLHNKFADEFKKDVVDGLLAEMEEEKK